jgi:hypothetical protein
MPIDESQLHPVFRASTLAQKRQEDKLKDWKAVFYTLRGLNWREACKNLRQEGLAKEELIYQADGEVTTADGLPITAYFEEHKPDFYEGFDRMFCKATVEEMLSYIETHYGLNKDEVMALNAERMAEYRKRETTKPYYGQLKDPVAEEQARKGKKRNKLEPNF